MFVSGEAGALRVAATDLPVGFDWPAAGVELVLATEELAFVPVVRTAGEAPPVASSTPPTGIVEVVLGERPSGAGDPGDQLVGVGGASRPGALDLLRVRVQRGQRVGGRRRWGAWLPIRYYLLDRYHGFG